MFLLRLASNEQRWITMETRGRWSSFDVSFALSRGGKTNTLTRTKFARPNKIQRFSLEMEYSLDDEYRPILRVPPFSSIFLERKLGVDDICTPDRPRKQRGVGDQWNSASVNLCRWNVETNRSGKVENNRSSVEKLCWDCVGRIHREWYRWKLSHRLSLLATLEGGWDVKAFVRFEFLRRVCPLNAD